MKFEVITMNNTDVLPCPEEILQQFFAFRKSCGKTGNLNEKHINLIDLTVSICSKQNRIIDHS